MVKKQSKKLAAKNSAKSTHRGMPVTLHAIRLVDNRSEQTHIPAKPLSKLSVKAQCETGEPRNLNGSWLLAYRVGAEILWACDPEDSEMGSRLSATCRYEAQFIAEHKPSTEEAKEVATLAAHCCWPYVRAFISGIIREMGQQPIVLPLMRIDAEHGMRFMTPAVGGALQPVTE